MASLFRSGQERIGQPYPGRHYKDFNAKRGPPVEPDVKSLLPSRQKIEKMLGRRVDKLPPFPLVALRLLEITRDDSKSSADIAKVVEADPAIAAKTLRIVNSAAYGALRQISSIKHAVVLLGALEIRSIALGVTLFETMIRTGGHRDFDPVFFWKHSIAMGALCRAMAEALAYPDPEEAYVAGLLHDIGKVILDSYGKIRYGDFLGHVADGTETMTEAEARVLGLRHDDVGAYFCDTWKMPERLICSILLHHRRFKHLKPATDEALLIAVVSLSDFITWTQGIGSFNRPGQPVLSPEVESIIDIQGLDLQALMTRMDREIQTTAEYYGFNFPSMENFRERLLRANIELGQRNARHKYTQGSLKRELETITRLRESIIQPHRSLDPRKIITGTLETIRQSFKFDRVFAMKVDPVHRHLTIVAGVDRRSSGNDLKKMRIRLDSSDSGFVSCLREHVPVLIGGRTGDERKALKLLKSRQLGIVPFSNQDKVIGIIAMDNAASGRLLRLSDLSAVAIVANELGLALGKARTFEEIKTRASRDGLTNIYNRASIETFLAESFKRARSGGAGLAVVMLDVDHFKRLNDTFGHTAGDSILKLIAGTLTKFSRPQIVGRYGGEEFLCILNNTDIDGAFSYAERIRSKVEELGRLLAKRFSGYTLTISLGVAVYEEGVDSVKALIDRADQAMYQAKESGRNQVMRFHPQ